MTELLIKWFIKDADNVTDTTVRKNYGTLGSLVGIVCNLLLCSFKITVGGITGSISIVADGLNNLSDMGSSVVAMLGFKLADKPADSDHPFGHGRMEYMSAFVVAILILLVGFELLKSSVTALINNTAQPQYTYFALAVLLVSILFKLWMFLFNRKLGKKIGSGTLFATAQDSLNDVVATSVILISAVVCKIFTLPFNLDAVMGIFVALFIIFSGITAAKDTINQILGEPPEKSLIDDIENTILSFKEFVGIHDLIVHNYGPGRQFASVHVEVPQDIDIVKCHEQIDLCEKLVGEKLDINLVIHMDPIDVNDESVLATKRNIAEGLKIIDSGLTLHDFRMTPQSDTRTNLIFDVVMPSDLKISEKELEQKIIAMARLINPTFCPVITFDRDFTGTMK